MTNKPKIAFVGNDSFSMYTYRLGVMKDFARNYDVSVIASRDECTDLIIAENLHYIELKHDRSTNVFDNLRFFATLYRILKQNRFDLVINYTIKPIVYGSMACRLLRIKTIAVTTGLGCAFSNNGLLNTIAKTLYYLSLKKAEEMWFLNNDDRNLFVTHRLIAPQKTFVLPSEGVNSNHFAPKATTPKSTFRFVLLSRLIFDKGIAKYAEAAKIIRAKHDNVECFLYGKIIAPSPQSVPETLIREWDTAGIVHYGGNILDVRPTIADADCVVLPSFYSEGVPRCLMEAMSMQKPIITTDNVGCKELIRDGENGYQCERKSAEDLARAMEKMIQLSCEERQKMGEAGRKLILEKFDEQRIIEIYHKKIDGYFDK